MFATGGAAVDRHFMFDLANDPDEAENRVGSMGEGEMLELLRHALTSLEAPSDQLTRLGL